MYVHTLMCTVNTYIHRNMVTYVMFILLYIQCKCLCKHTYSMYVHMYVRMYVGRYILHMVCIHSVLYIIRMCINLS